MLAATSAYPNSLLCSQSRHSPQSQHPPFACSLALQYHNRVLSSISSSSSTAGWEAEDRQRKTGVQRDIKQAQQKSTQLLVPLEDDPARSPRAAGGVKHSRWRSPAAVAAAANPLSLASQQPFQQPRRQQRQQDPQLQRRPSLSPWDLQLASMPGLRKRFVPAPGNIQVPALSSLIVVEGWTDAQAVQRAVNAAVCTLWQANESACMNAALCVCVRWRQREIQSCSKAARSPGPLEGDIVVLTDPDAGGRMLRIFLDDTFRQRLQQQQQRATKAQQQSHERQQQHASAPQLQQQKQQQSVDALHQQPLVPHQQRQHNIQPSDACLPKILHAFIPIADAASSVANSRHDVGSVGVENAAPDAILSSLERAGPSFHGRQEFSQMELMEAGFINAYNNKQIQGAKLRREVLCSALGVDNCTGGALVTALNRFFTRQQYEHAVSQAEAQCAASNFMHKLL